MLISMLFDEDENEETVTALFQVGPHIVQIKQRPHEGRVCDRELERKQEETTPADAAGVAAATTAGSGGTAATTTATPLADPAAAAAAYTSAFPNVGLVVWQAGFVLAAHLLARQPPPLSSWRGARVLELGAGVGQLGCALAMTGAAVTMTDLPHIVPWTERNIGLNAHAMPVRAKALPYCWGADPAASGLGGAADWDLIVAADVLYEPQHYGLLLASLLALLCGSSSSSGSALKQTSQLEAAAAGEASEAAVAASADAATAAATPSSSSPPRCFLCYRQRQYREGGFETAAERAGFRVDVTPTEALPEGYQCGGYRLIELVVLPEGGGGAGGGGR